MTYTLGRMAEPWRCYKCGKEHDENDRPVTAKAGSHTRNYCAEPCGLAEMNDAGVRLEGTIYQTLLYVGRDPKDAFLDDLVEDEIEQARRTAG